MSHPLLTSASMVRDGVLIGLEADSLERRVKAFEATRRAAEALIRLLDSELNHLNR